MEILLDDFLKAVLKEDIGRGDLYSKIENNIQVESYILAKESGILSGRIYVERLCKLLGIEVNFVIKDGMEFKMADEMFKFILIEEA